MFYRATCVRKAVSLGVTGHARNLPDGRVEVLACGDQRAVETFIAWLWEGSPASRVTGVDTKDVECVAAQRPAEFTSA